MRHINTVCHNNPKHETSLMLGKTPMWYKNPEVLGTWLCWHCRYDSLNVGERHGNWRGGITKFRNMIKNSGRYKSFRKIILIRDDFTCQNCNIKFGRNMLEVHHIVKSFLLLLDSNNIKQEQTVSDMPDEIFDPVYAITMCEECHLETPDYGQKAK